MMAIDDAGIPAFAALPQCFESREHARSFIGYELCSWALG